MIDGLIESVKNMEHSYENCPTKSIKTQQMITYVSNTVRLLKNTNI